MSLASGTRLALRQAQGDLEQGRKVGPHEVLGLIGAGGMGEVYQARDTRLDRTVAIKVLLPELSTDAKCRARRVWPWRSRSRSAEAEASASIQTWRPGPGSFCVPRPRDPGQSLRSPSRSFPADARFRPCIQPESARRGIARVGAVFATPTTAWPAWARPHWLPLTVWPIVNPLSGPVDCGEYCGI